MEQKKILVLLDGPIRNDGRVRRVIESLSDLHMVDLYCVYSDFDDQLLFNKNVKVYHYKKSTAWLRINFQMHKVFDDLLIQFENHNASYDYIYCNDYPLLATAVRLKRITGAKLIYDSHEIYIETINQFFPKKGWKQLYGKPLTAVNKVIHRRVENKNVKEVNKIITVGESFKDYFEKEWNINEILVVKNCPKDIEVQHNPSLLREKLGLTSKDKILLYQGNVNISRGIDTVAEAMPLIEENIHFVVIGDGPTLEVFKEQYKNSRIHFYGRVPFEQLYEYTTSCDVAIMLIERYNLSKMLTLPNKAFEYMVASKPFITNDLPEASKIIKEENCGFIIDDSSPEKIASAINAIFKRTDLKEMGKKGRKAVEEKYNWGKEVEKLITYIEK